jgi:RNA polymerase sigma-70 factor (ECF subfamily)
VNQRHADSSGEVAELYTATSRRLLGLIIAVSGDRGEAEDVVHEAYARLLLNWQRVRDYDNPEAWVRTIAMRLLISRHRRRRPALTALRLLRDSSPIAGAELNPERVAMIDALHTLSVDQRAVMVLHYYLDLDITAIAAQLGIATGTVKSRLSRGRSALASYLTEELQP